MVRKKSARSEEELTFARHLDRLLSAPGAPSAAEIGRRAGFDSAVMSDYRKGLRVPRVHYARRIADALGVGLDEMTDPVRRLGAPPAEAPAGHPLDELAGRSEPRSDQGTGER